MNGRLPQKSEPLLAKSRIHFRPQLPAYSQIGQGMAEYALILALVAVAAIATLILIGPDIGDVFSNFSAALDDTSPAENEIIVVTVLDAENKGIENVRVYAYDNRGRYRGRSGRTGANGQITFDLPDGRYKFRARYQAQNFWSNEINWPNEWRAVINTGQRPFTVSVVDDDGQGIPDRRVQTFTASGRYVNMRGRTDENGQIIFNLADGDYKFRARYQGKWFWSDPVNTPDKNAATIDTGRQGFVVDVVDAAGQGIANVRVYAFTDDNRYFGLNGRTDSNGQIWFELSDGRYKFRADYQGKQFWSAEVTSPDDGSAAIDTGQRPFTVNVLDAAGQGLDNVRVYAFTDQNRYIGVTGRTDDAGQLSFDLSDGRYQFRADYQGKQFWSGTAVSPDTTSANIDTGQRPFTVNVADAAGQGIANVRVYAFTDQGRYIGVTGRTDNAGQTLLHLSDGAYKFRADYQGRRFWSNVVNSPAVTAATIETGQQPFTVRVVDAAGQGIDGVRVYAFTSSGGYVGQTGRTGVNGVVVLDLAAGAYKFRADYQAQQIWSEDVTLPDVTEATIDTGQRPFTVHVQNGDGSPAASVWVYAFTENGRFTGVYGRTDTNGQVRLDIANGSYKFRADSGGQQYWSDVITTPDVGEITISIGG